MLLTVTKVFVSVLLLGGSFMILAGALGIIRFPDFYCRGHASAMGPTVGVMMIMLGSGVFYAISGNFFSHNILAIVFILITVPLGCHLLLKNSYHSGIEMQKAIRDDWKDDHSTNQKCL